MAASLKVTVSSHHFKVEPFSEAAKAVCYEFAKRFLKIDIQNKQRTITTFAAANASRSWFRFHINTLQEFYAFARNRNYPLDKIDVVTRALKEPKKVHLPIKPAWVLHDYQEPIVNYLVQKQDETKPKSRLVGIQTGRGKTLCALAAISKIGFRVFCVVKPKYIEKWVGDFCNVLDIKPKDILVVQGGNALQSLTQMALTKGDLDPYKAIIVSNRTMDNYLKAYEAMGNNLDNMGYMVNPDELMEKLDVGVLLRDEAHEEFHSVFRLDLYLHVPLTINLTATLVNLDQTLVRMYEVMFPSEHRYAEGEINKYADAYGVTYRVNPNYRLKTTERGQSTYSHNAYESSILKNDTFTHNYANMLKYYLDRGFVLNYVPGNKAIVFASSVAMCTKLTEKLSDFYPQYNVKRYVAEDDYQLNYQKPDIRVTTIGSGGTGHDIKGLTDGHMTNAIDSIQANIQAFGRLRDLKEKQTRFFFYSCEQIPKHMKYAHKKGELMGQRAKSYSRITYREL